jgi:Tfp pilus assembly protein PilN
MNALLLVSGGGVLAMTIALFVAARRRVRSAARNNRENEAFLAREAEGSWSENECAVGHEDAAPPCIFPGVR